MCLEYSGSAQALIRYAYPRLKYAHSAQVKQQLLTSRDYNGTSQDEIRV